MSTQNESDFDLLPQVAVPNISHNERYPKPKTTPLANPMPTQKSEHFVTPNIIIRTFHDTEAIQICFGTTDQRWVSEKEFINSFINAPYMGSDESLKNRKVIQMVGAGDSLVVLFDDGTMWETDELETEPMWRQVGAPRQY